MASNDDGAKKKPATPKPQKPTFGILPVGDPIYITPPKKTGQRPQKAGDDRAKSEDE